jgi:hypothetical protein
MRTGLLWIAIFIFQFANCQIVSDTTKAKSPSDIKNQNVLIVVDGIVQPKKGIQNIDSNLVKVNLIESMRVLNGKLATDKYGDRGKDGVIEITLKKEVGKGLAKEYDLVETSSDNTPIFSKVEIDPAFPGGEKEWRRFLEKNLDASVPVDSGAHEGTYTVVLQFIVDKDGTISDLKALTNQGYGMEEECLRLMKLSPKWAPGIQNGRNVKAYKKQPITFVIAEEDEAEEVKEDNNIIFTKPEIEASFPGGSQSWKSFLEKNLNANTPIKNKAPIGTYTVVILFVVDKSGKTSEFKALTSHGYGMEEECLRVLKKSPTWVPAIQNGRNVKAYRKQPITFVVAKD